jgi:hypothetical protein
MEFLAPLFASDNYDLTRLLFLRAMAAMYLLAFIITLNQFRALVGEYGLMPVRDYLPSVRFRDAPSLFWLNCSDRFMLMLSWAGIILSLLALTGITDHYGFGVYLAVWIALWVLYQSFVNTGQEFYSFGWEILLLEAGFLVIFLGPASVKVAPVVIWLLWWLLFRVMFGAGMIKLRGDECWRDLTCMYYHYESQPLPNPLSWYLHRLPMPIHKAGVLFTHFVELPLPWFYFVPGPLRYGAGVLTIVFQIMLILSGNLSWLNYITIVLCIPLFDDSMLARLLPEPQTVSADPPLAWIILISALLVTVIVLSIKPLLNLFSRHQLMNESYDPLHLVNTYGAFGSITRERFEIVIEGTAATQIDDETEWLEYQFKAKPGDIHRMPAIISPYQLHLDWQMWFEAMTPRYVSTWLLALIGRLLENDPAIVRLMGFNPFPDAPPNHIRLLLYRYNFSLSRTPGNAWWRRTPHSYLLWPMSLSDPDFREVLTSIGWRSRTEQKNEQVDV